MPPRTNVTARASIESFATFSELLFCPSCSLWRLPPGSRRAPLFRRRNQTVALVSHGPSQSRSSQNRAYSTGTAAIVGTLRSSKAKTSSYDHIQRISPPATQSYSVVSSVTNVNATVDVPQPYKNLYRALATLNEDAASYVNISALQLALHGLESQDPTIRIGILAMRNSQKSSSKKTARRLARLLLADPLGPSEQWEKQLEEAMDEDGRSLLIRYGEEGDLEPPNPLVRTVLVPSLFLQKHNIEVLITTLQTGESGLPSAPNTEIPKEAVLVPLLSYSPGPSMPATTVSYPIHRALVVGDGLESCVAFGRFMGHSTIADFPSNSVMVVVDTPQADSARSVSNAGEVIGVDLDAGSNALEKFRESVGNAILYERGWSRSNLSTVSAWAIPERSPSGALVKPAIYNTISSLLKETNAAIVRQETARLQALLDSSVSSATRRELITALDRWAKSAHEELRDSLDAAFHGRSWRKLAWWKLPWRVDDVSMIAGEALERQWLVGAEKGLVWLAGRCEQAGLHAEAVRLTAAVTAKEPLAAEVRTLNQALAHTTSSSWTPSTPSAVTLEPTSPPPPPSAPSATPWPQHIHHSRTNLLNRTVPPLQSLAQRLVLSAASLTATGAALSALAFAATTATTLAEAGVLVALAATVAMRNTQKKWEAGRGRWEGEVREEGKRALRRVEGGLRGVIEAGGRGRVDEEAVRAARAAVEAVRRAREELVKVGGREQKDGKV